MQGWPEVIYHLMQTKPAISRISLNFCYINPHLQSTHIHINSKLQGAIIIPVTCFHIKPTSLNAKSNLVHAPFKIRVYFTISTKQTTYTSGLSLATLCSFMQLHPILISSESTSGLRHQSNSKHLNLTYPALSPDLY